MALQDKYKQLIDAAAAQGIQAAEKEGVLYFNGEVPNGATKDQLWDLYGQADPDFKSGDVVMDVKVSPVATGTKALVTTESSNLNIRKGPGTDQPIVGKAAHQETVTIVNQTNDQWWLIRTDAGEEGYAYAQYLSPQ